MSTKRDGRNLTSAFFVNFSPNYATGYKAELLALVVKILLPNSDSLKTMIKMKTDA